MIDARRVTARVVAGRWTSAGRATPTSPPQLPYLANRPDVDPDRIGVVGMSMGGEEALGATATNHLLRAVVAEGATARSAADKAWLSDQFGVRGVVQEQLERVQDWATDALTSASVPASSRAAVEASDARYLLITAGDIVDKRLRRRIPRRRGTGPGADLDSAQRRTHRRPPNPARRMGSPCDRLPHRVAGRRTEAPG